MRASIHCVRGVRTAESGHKPAWRRKKPTRRGNIVVFSAFLMVIMMAMVALSVDVGYVYTMQAQLQRSVDAAALAGTADLAEGIEKARDTAKEYLVRNPVGSQMSFISDDILADELSAWEEEHGDKVEMQVGNWNPATRQFEETSVMPSSLTVTMTYPQMPLFFARVLGHDSVTIRASSTAMFQPRDIVVVLDYSASMNDDSTFAALGKLGRSDVENSLRNCWNDLGPPSYGNLVFEPKWAVFHGVPENTSKGIPHISVEYRFSSVHVASSQSISSVKLEYSNGSQQTFSPGVQSAALSGTGSNAGRQITKAWVRSWNNGAQFGSSGEPFDLTSNATLKRALGLSTVAYPYPAGSWDDYLNYVKSSNGLIAQGGYRYKFGGMNLVHYWLDKHPEHDQVPDLWKCRAEPVNALRSAFHVFTNFMGAVDTQDRVGLVIYNAPDGEGLLEHELTGDYAVLDDLVKHRQAGHYHNYTNIGGGLHSGRVHLDQLGRPNAKKMIVLMTDGLANWKNNNYNEAVARQYVLDEAALCAAESRRYKIMTVSVGVGADTALMDQVANMTEGKHFNVPGGSSHADMYEQLYAAFEQIAKARAMMLVQ